MFWFQKTVQSYPSTAQKKHLILFPPSKRFTDTKIDGFSFQAVGEGEDSKAENKICIAQVAHLPYYYTPVIFRASWDPNIGSSLLDR